MTLDELAREGAKRIIKEALLLEVADYIEAVCDLRDENGRALAVRNGYGKARKLTVGSGTIEVATPRVRDRRIGAKFTSAILPPYMRRSPKVTEVLPILYLKGLSTGNFS
ncbi:MAG: transposase, partial [Actinomycetota bacterium]|nr:transposase [Actinomycetota bacterium]